MTRGISVYLWWYLLSSDVSYFCVHVAYLLWNTSCLTWWATCELYIDKCEQAHTIDTSSGPTAIFSIVCPPRETRRIPWGFVVKYLIVGLILHFDVSPDTRRELTSTKLAYNYGVSRISIPLRSNLMTTPAMGCCDYSSNGPLVCQLPQYQEWHL